MSSTFYRVLLISLLIPFASTGAPAVHRGWFRAGCGNTSFHIPHVSELNGEELVLKIGGDFPGPSWAAYVNQGEWMDVPAERCTNDSKCLPLKRFRIWFDHLHRKLKNVRGKYAFDIESQHVEGIFVARDNTSPDLRCE